MKPETIWYVGIKKTVSYHATLGIFDVVVRTPLRRIYISTPLMILAITTGQVISLFGKQGEYEKQGQKNA